MTQPRKLSEREPIIFILLLILMAVLFLGGRAKRQTYDAAQFRATHSDLKTFDASKHDQLAPATATNE